MCIYCNTTDYRKIYESHYGPIPKDETGRTYEIHHIDGVHSNNTPSNLKCVSIQEHYDIHYSQSDWMACFRISKKMKILQQQIADLVRKHSLERVKNGTHPFLNCNKGIEHPMFDHTIYTFTNFKTNVTETTTQYDLRTRYRLNSGNLSEMIRGNRKTVSGWRVVQT